MEQSSSEMTVGEESDVEETVRMLAGDVMSVPATDVGSTMLHDAASHGYKHTNILSTSMYHHHTMASRSENKNLVL